jgi:hypothetical protein
MENFKKETKTTETQPIDFLYVAPPGLNKEPEQSSYFPTTIFETTLHRIGGYYSRFSIRSCLNFINKKADTPENQQVRDFLKSAPQKGLWMPLGKEVKIMQCWRCKAYGHRTGDRECPLRMSGNAAIEEANRVMK